MRPVSCHVDDRALLDLPSGLVPEGANALCAKESWKCSAQLRLHGLNILGQLQVLDAAIGCDDALLDFIAPHVAVNEISQQMRVYNGKLCLSVKEESREFKKRERAQDNAAQCAPPAMTRRTKMLD